jgi:hypothetical protein
LALQVLGLARNVPARALLLFASMNDVFQALSDAIEHDFEPTNDTDLVITIVQHDGSRTTGTCDTGKRWEVPVGKRLRFVVDPRTPVSEEPWSVRLLDRDHVLEEWTLSEPTPRSISVSVRPAAACAYLSVRNVLR